MILVRVVLIRALVAAALVGLGLVTGGSAAEVCFVLAIVLAAALAGDGADLLLERGRRRTARIEVLLAITALTAISAVSYRQGHPPRALVAALLAGAGPLARRAFPGLPRARVVR